MSNLFVLAAAQPVPNYTLTTPRLIATAGVLIALAGVVIGGLALARRSGRRWALTALTTGATGTIIGAVIIALAKGGPGTGYGIVGGYLAVVLGLVAMLLGGLSRSRSRRTPDRIPG